MQPEDTGYNQAVICSFTPSKKCDTEGMGIGTRPSLLIKSPHVPRHFPSSCTKYDYFSPKEQRENEVVLLVWAVKVKCFIYMRTLSLVCVAEPKDSTLTGQCWAGCSSGLRVATGREAAFPACIRLWCKGYICLFCSASESSAFICYHSITYHAPYVKNIVGGEAERIGYTGCDKERKEREKIVTKKW